jgi:formylglycine-generating enzyme required for sulfatase activity
MVSLGAFCIDATEVTNAGYAAWLATGPSTAGQPSFCAWNTSYTPSSAWPAPATEANHPVVWVDWCDAFAYCAAAGKRLCGHIGGGAGPYGAGFADPTQSEWMAACSNGSATAYPYGAGYAADVCDGKDYQHPTKAIAVGSAAACHGVGAPYAAIFDMSGNVAEWEDACSGASGSADPCRSRGGSYSDASGALRCDADVESSTRGATSATIGFRCCGG